MSETQATTATTQADNASDNTENTTQADEGSTTTSTETDETSSTDETEVEGNENDEEDNSEEEEQLSLAEAKKLRSEAKNLRDRLKAAEERLAAYGEATPETIQTLQTETADYQAKIQTIEETYAVRDEATKQGAIDPDVVSKFIPADALKWEDGKLTGHAEAVTEVLKQYPYLKKPAVGETSGRSGNPGKKGTDTLTKDSATPDRVRNAVRSGEMSLEQVFKATGTKA